MAEINEMRRRRGINIVNNNGCGDNNVIVDVTTSEDGEGVSSSMSADEIRRALNAGKSVVVEYHAGAEHVQINNLYFGDDNSMEGIFHYGNCDYKITINRDKSVSFKEISPTPIPSSSVEWYGIEINEAVADPATAVKRIGNLDYHRSLPVQSQMRRCLLLDDGTVNYYLDSEDSTKKEDGSTAVLDGTDGQVMVEIPDHYLLIEKKEQGYRSVVVAKISADPTALPSAVFVPKHYVSAYQAYCYNRDGQMYSIVGEKPTIEMTIEDFRFYANARNQANEHKWCQYTYDDAVDVYWLYLIEYANRNSQAEFIAELTEEGYHQGGLGMGATFVEGFDSSSYPAFETGLTNSLGNNTGEIITLYDNGVDKVEVPINSYRGIEMPFGNINTFLDGIFYTPNTLYRCNKPANYASVKDYDSTFTYKEGNYVMYNQLFYVCIKDAVGVVPTNTTYWKPVKPEADLGYYIDSNPSWRSGAMRSLNAGINGLSIIASDVLTTKDSDEYYCDQTDLGGSTCCFKGGGLTSKNEGECLRYGLAYIESTMFDYKDESIGARLCYHGTETTIE